MGPSGFFPCSFWPSRQGEAKITKSAIVPDRDARPFRPSGGLFWSVFSWDLCPSYDPASVFPSLGDVDAFLTLWVSCKVHLFLLLRAVLTLSTDCLKPFRFSSKLPALQGTFLQSCLALRDRSVSGPLLLPLLRRSGPLFTGNRLYLRIPRVFIFIL